MWVRAAVCSANTGWATAGGCLVLPSGCRVFRHPTCGVPAITRFALQGCPGGSTADCAGAHWSPRGCHNSRAGPCGSQQICQALLRVVPCPVAAFWLWGVSDHILGNKCSHDNSGGCRLSAVESCRGASVGLSEAVCTYVASTCLACQRGFCDRPLGLAVGGARAGWQSQALKGWCLAGVDTHAPPPEACSACICIGATGCVSVPLQVSWTLLCLVCLHGVCGGRCALRPGEVHPRVCLACGCTVRQTGRQAGGWLTYTYLALGRAASRKEALPCVTPESCYSSATCCVVSCRKGRVGPSVNSLASHQPIPTYAPHPYARHTSTVTNLTCT